MTTTAKGDDPLAVDTTTTTCHDDDDAADNDNEDVDDEETSNHGHHHHHDVVTLASLPPPPRLGLARLLSSSCSIGSEESNPHCPICLDPMTAMDLYHHPLMCPTRHCHYNFCASCIKSLISSSKDDYEMASDGNAHVKIHLNCPNCRADLSQTIRDVLLLRKVDTVTWLTSTTTTTTTTTSTDTVSLTPSQERTRIAMQELDVQETIQKARDVEASFWRQYSKNNNNNNSSSSGSGNSIGSDAPVTLSPKSRMARAAASQRRPSLHRLEESIQELSTSMQNASFDNDNHDDDDDEEWGVEADLISGVHNSIRLPRDQRFLPANSSNSSSPSKKSNFHGRNHNQKNKNKKTIDPTVMSGLEYCMTLQEKLQITQWMTSGNTNDLVLAAKLLQELEAYARQGIPPSQRHPRRGSVYEIVEETRKVHEQQQEEEKKDNQEAAAATALLGGGANTTTTTTTTRGGVGPSAARGPRRNLHNNNRTRQILAERRQLELAVQEQAHLLERFPLPVRMPKSVQLELRAAGHDVHATAKRFPLLFCNDTWDGTVLDAYSKLTITGRPPNCTVTKKKTQHAGVYHVLSLGKYTQHYGPVEMTLSLEHPPARVLVASVQGEGGRKGIIKGDVVTHVDGEEFHGTVDDLLELLHTKASSSQRQQQQQKVEMILNAEPSVAEALRRRAIVLE